MSIDKLRREQQEEEEEAETCIALKLNEIMKLIYEIASHE